MQRRFDPFQEGGRPAWLGAMRSPGQNIENFDVAADRSKRPGRVAETGFVVGQACFAKVDVLRRLPCSSFSSVAEPDDSGLGRGDFFRYRYPALQLIEFVRAIIARLPQRHVPIGFGESTVALRRVFALQSLHSG